MPSCAATMPASCARWCRRRRKRACACASTPTIRPFDVFGLPRVVSTADDLQFIVDAVPSPANGITFCTGALGAGPANDVPAMAERFAQHIHFAHLRNVAKEPDGSFMEADHLAGDVDMVAVVATLMGEQARRKAGGRSTGACRSAPTTATSWPTISAAARIRATRWSAACAGWRKSAAS